MKNYDLNHGSTYYQKQNVSTCEIAGAVALCVVHDLRVNLFGIAGFPEIQVAETENGFAVTFSVTREERKQTSIVLSRDAAFAAAKRFKDKSKGYDPAIFDAVQEVLPSLVG